MNAILLVNTEERKNKIVELLAMQGYDVKAALDLTKACSLIKEDMFDLFVVNLDELSQEDIRTIIDIQNEKYHLFTIPLVFISSSLKKLRLLSENHTFKHFDYFRYPFNKEEIFLKLNTINTAKSTIDDCYKFCAELKEQEVRHKKIDDLADAAVFIVKVSPDRKLSFSQLSKGFIKITGYFLDDLGVESEINRIVFYDDRDIFHDFFEKILSGNSEEIKIRLITKSGSLMWVKISGAPEWDSIRSRISHIYCLCHDITEQISSNENILKFTLAVEQSPTAVIMTTVDGAIEYVNKKFSELTEYSFDEVRGKNPRILNSGFQTKEFYHEMWQTILSGKTWKGEMINRKKSGKLYWDNAKISPVCDSKKKIVFFVAIQEDITARKKAEEALIEGEAKTKAILDSSIDSIIVMNHNGEISYLNKAAEKIFGYESSEILGKELHSIIASPESREKFSSLYSGFVHSGRCKVKLTGNVLELQATKKDGSRFPIELSISSFKREGNWNAVGIVRDITQRKEIEKKVKEVINKLERSNSELDKFASIASHDLNEPLRAVITFSQILSEEHQDKLGEEAAEYLRIIVQSGRHMQALINDLLEYSRVGHRKESLILIDLEKLFNVVIQNLEIAIKSSGAIITHDPLPALMVDGTQIIQIFQNVIGNAIKFNNKGKVLIHVSCEKKKDEYLFSVKDNGIGIDARYLTKIFDIFERLHNKSVYPGTGIGLSICKKIAENHGGRIWVESTTGVGSIFYFSIRETSN